MAKREDPPPRVVVGGIVAKAPKYLPQAQGRGYCRLGVLYVGMILSLGSECENVATPKFATLNVDL